MTIETPVSSWKETVRPEWADYNGHMNVAYYTLIFDHAADTFFEVVGLGKPYVERTGNSVFAVEGHISYIREVNVDDEVIVTTQLLGFDDKRLHYFQEMRDVKSGALSATMEQLSIHVNLEKRRVEPFLEAPRRLLEDTFLTQSLLPVPPQVGRVISPAGKRG